MENPQFQSSVTTKIDECCSCAPFLLFLPFYSCGEHVELLCSSVSCYVKTFEENTKLRLNFY